MLNTKASQLHAQLLSASCDTVQAGPAAAAEPPAQSAFLHCVSQLNDVLRDHLLPKLVEQESAGAVRLTCSQLCALLQPNIQHLNLTKELQGAGNPLQSLQVARQCAAAFPSCTCLQFAWSSSSMAHVHCNISPLLAG
jgi:hypothetical protein